MKIRFEENTSPDIAHAASEGHMVVFPLGCTEQHGPHLPVMCDYGRDYGRPIKAAELAQQKYGAKVLILPTLPFGPAAEHTGFPGTISLSFETWSAVVVEVLGNLVRDGFRKIVVTKSCGGHMGIEGPVFEFYAEMKRRFDDLDIRVYGEQGWAEAAKLIKASGIFDPKEVHAGGMETSMALASFPELVHLDRLRKPEKQGTSWSGCWWIMEELSETGATGDPTRYDVELGRKIINCLDEALGDFLGSMWRQDGDCT